MRYVEQLETRRLMAAFTASSVAELVSDINAANAAGGANSIALAAGSTFQLVSAADGDNGLPTIAGGDDLTIIGNASSIQRSTKRGTPAFRLFNVASGGALTLNNLTLSGGLIAGSGSGGGIQNDGTLNLNGVTVQNCTVEVLAGASTGVPALGGGIYSGFGVLTIANSTIRNNQALGPNGTVSAFGFGATPGGPAEGGGVYVIDGTATVTNTTFSSNLAQGGDGANGQYQRSGTHGGDGLGGAIYAEGATVQIRGTTITGNSASGGTGGRSQKGLPKGADGAGRGGGLYIAPAAVVSLDSFTQAHTTGNTASTSDNDIFGSFTILA